MLTLGGKFFFFFNDTATTEIYTLSLHDALPISVSARWGAPLLAHVRCERPFRQPTTRCKRWIRVPMFPSSLRRHCLRRYEPYRVGHPRMRPETSFQIGRASCRERV